MYEHKGKHGSTHVMYMNVSNCFCITNEGHFCDNWILWKHCGHRKVTKGWLWSGIFTLWLVEELKSSLESSGSVHNNWCGVCGCSSVFWSYCCPLASGTGSQRCRPAGHSTSHHVAAILCCLEMLWLYDLQSVGVWWAGSLFFALCAGWTHRPLVVAKDLDCALSLQPW